jgi:hypothetical protein
VNGLVDYKAREIPSMIAASSEFVSAAETQSEALGYMPAPVFLFKTRSISFCLALTS